MKLRSYQEQLNIDILEQIDTGHKRVLAVMPTGSGKGTTISALVQAFSNVGKRCYILAHRNELIGDLSNRIGKLGITHGVISPHYPENTGLLIQVGSVQTVARRLDKLPVPDVIIQDEAHHLVVGNTWGKIIDHWPEAILIGKTATPIRLSGQGLGEGHGGYFTSMVVGPSASWLTENGFLSPLKVFAPPIGFSASGMRKVAGDFSMKSASERLKAGEIMGDVVSHYKKHLDGKTAIAFCCTVKHAEQVAAFFNAAKINAASIDGTMSAEQRNQLLSDLESGELKVLTSCQLIGEGIDIPNVTGCILLRPTASITLHLQMIGRALRPQEGKTAIILDHVGNTLRLGHPMYFVEDDWSLDGKPIDKTGGGGDAIKVCPDCNSVIPRNSRECPECGHDFTVDPIELKIVNGELVEISPYEELRPIIEPMVEEGIGLNKISKILFQLGHTNSLGKAFNSGTLSVIIKKLGLKLKNKQDTTAVSDEELEKLRPIIGDMIERGMVCNQISEKLFEMGFTNAKKVKLSDTTITKLLRRLGFKTKNYLVTTSLTNAPVEKIKSVIEPMVENIMSIRQIAQKLSEMGYTTNTGGKITDTNVSLLLKKTGLETKTKYSKRISSDYREELYPIIKPMVETGMAVHAIANKLFELGYTNGVGNAFDYGTLKNILKNLGLETKTIKYSKRISSDYREELYPIIKPMVETGMAVHAIANKLFELGYTTGSGNALDRKTVKIILRNLGLNTKNMERLQPT